MERWSSSNLKLLLALLLVLKENKKVFITILRSVYKGQCFTLRGKINSKSLDFCGVRYLRIRQINVILSKQLIL